MFSWQYIDRTFNYPRPVHCNCVVYHKDPPFLLWWYIYETLRLL